MACKDCKCNKKNEMIHLIQTDLQRIYKKETGSFAEVRDDNGNLIYTDEYFNWLEEKVLRSLNEEMEIKEILDECNAEVNKIMEEENGN